MSKQVARLSLQWKLVGLISILLGLSLFSFFTMARNLVLEDKTSYIFDYSLSTVRSLSEPIHREIEATLETLTQAQTGAPRVRKNAVSYYLHSETTARAIDRTGIPSSPEELAFSPDQLAQLRSGSVIQVPQSGKFRLFGRVPQMLSKTMPWNSYLVEFQFDSTALEAGADTQVLLVTRSGDVLFESSLHFGDQAKTWLQDALPRILKFRDASGVQEARIGGTQFLMGYSPIASNEIVLMTFLDKEIAYKAAKNLEERSLVMAASILCIALALSLWLIRSATQTLRDLWAGTQQVAQGHFQLRLQTKNRFRDEVSDLAESFNQMSSKIEELLAETREKARMEKELETAQLIQGLFFPAPTLSNEHLFLSGQYLPASECAGDWWHYHQSGNHILFVAGDVTGHGVSAALITAAVHAVYQLVIQEFDLSRDPNTFLVEMLERMNQVVRPMSRGQSGMSLFAGILEQESGTLTYVNASHPPPLISGESPTGSPLKQFRTAKGGRCPALGSQERLNPEAATEDLAPGDTLILYTDGLTEVPVDAGLRFTKSGFYELLTHTLFESKTPTVLAERILSATLNQMPEETRKSRSDDITIITIQRTSSGSAAATPSADVA